MQGESRGWVWITITIVILATVTVACVTGAGLIKLGVWLFGQTNGPVIGVGIILFILSVVYVYITLDE